MKNSKKKWQSPTLKQIIIAGGALTAPFEGGSFGIAS
jgi:hypothetical protein